MIAGVLRSHVPLSSCIISKRYTLKYFRHYNDVRNYNVQSTRLNFSDCMSRLICVDVRWSNVQTFSARLVFLPSALSTVHQHYERKGRTVNQNCNKIQERNWFSPARFQHSVLLPSQIPLNRIYLQAIYYPTNQPTDRPTS